MTERRRADTEPGEGAGPDAIAALIEKVAELRVLTLQRLERDEMTELMCETLSGQLTDTREALADRVLAPLVQDLIDLVDTIDSMLETRMGQQHADLCKVADSVVRILRRHGVYEMDVVSQSFDPLRHDAVGEIPVIDPVHHDRVVQQCASGYLMRGEPIRRARVIVGRFGGAGQRQ